MLSLACSFALALPMPAHFGNCPLPANAEYVRSSSGLELAIYKKGDIVSDNIRKSGTWETHPWNALKPYMSASTVFIDIGANIGWYTLNLARSHNVVAFEPFESNLALLNASLCANPSLKLRIRVMAHGLSDKATRCDLYQDPSVNFGDTVSACDGEGGDQKRIGLGKAGYQKLGEMRAHRLGDVADAALLQANKVVKMDVEGHEYEVILGAERFFTTGNQPLAVYAEVFQLGTKREPFIAKLKEWGYETKASKDDNDALFVRSDAASVPKIARIMDKDALERRRTKK